MRKIGGIKAVTVTKVERSPVATTDAPARATPNLMGRPEYGASKDALHNAAWYFGTLLCDRNDHKPEFGTAWPCQRCYGYAHDLLTEHATTIIIREKTSGKHRQSAGKARVNSGGTPGKKSGGKSGVRRR